MTKLITSKIIKALLFVVLLAGILYSLSYIFSPKRTVRPWDVSSKINGFYEIEKNTLDIVFVGSSHTFCTFDPYIFQKEGHIKSYVFASNQQPLSVTYYYIKEVLKHQSPKAIVLELLYVSEKEEYITPKMIHFAADDLPWTQNKLELLKNNLENKDLSNFSSLYNYHDRWKDLDFKDFQNSKNLKFFGFTPLYRKESKSLLFGEFKPKPLPTKSQEYLDKIIALLKETKTELIFTYAPHYAAKEERQSHLATVAKIAKKNDIDFINYMDKTLLNEINFDITTDFDGWHTNVYGAHKVSKHLAKYLGAKYEFDKNRDFNEYNLVAEYYKMADSLPKIKNLDDYIDYLSDKDVFVAIAVKDAANSHINNKLKPLGSNVDWENAEKYSYIGLFNPAKGFEFESLKLLSLNQKFPKKANQPFSVQIKSAGALSGNYAEIYINNRGNLLNKKAKRGINIVIFNANMDSVLDIVNFDTYKEANPSRQ